MTAGLSLAVFGLLTNVGQGWGDLPVTGSLAGGALLPAAFVAVEARTRQSRHARVNRRCRCAAPSAAT
ncbi:hypothetical protein [Streptacidiphilus sp. MAP12-16]|uniref:hypothetical protein n=1 Tax=Streptacidiphilus sp. MAP12-16 TaxID=3156300 RepID=UPI0035135813